MFRFLWTIIRLNTKHSTGTSSNCVGTYALTECTGTVFKETETCRWIFNIHYRYILLCSWLNKLLYNCLKIILTNDWCVFFSFCKLLLKYTLGISRYQPKKHVSLAFDYDAPLNTPQKAANRKNVPLQWTEKFWAHSQLWSSINTFDISGHYMYHQFQ